MRIALSALILSAPLLAQEPVVRPAAGVVGGIVRDAGGSPIQNAEVSLGASRRTHTAADGSFRFERVEADTHRIRARRIGFRAETRSVVVRDSAVFVEFRLAPLPNVLPAVVTSVSRGGLSGIVVDSALGRIANAKVEVFGAGKSAMTDSSGAFFIAARPGKYALQVERPGYATRMLSVAVPEDSGRHIVVALSHASRGATTRQAVAMFELRSRLVRATGPTAMRLYTREDLDRLGPREAVQLVSFAASRPIDHTICKATIDGDRGKSLWLADLDLADVELLEIYASAKSKGCPGVIAWLRK